jgi:hypothetical protein
MEEAERKHASRLEQQLAESRLQLLELQIRQMQEPKGKGGFWSNPLLLAIAGATATAIVGLMTNKAQLDANRRLERDKLESSLILKAIDTEDQERRLQALQFLVKVGLVSDPDGKIVALDSSQVPRIQVTPSSDFRKYEAVGIVYSPEIVRRILTEPGVPYPDHAAPVRAANVQIKGIVLHVARGPDASIEILRNGRTGLPGPLAHWAVMSDGRIEFIAPEGQRANHVGKVAGDLKNANTIGIQVTGESPFTDSRQLENLVRLVVDVADRWDVSTEAIVGHGELAPGRKDDMLGQAPTIRQMVAAIRNGRKKE